MGSSTKSSNDEIQIVSLPGQRDSDDAPAKARRTTLRDRLREFFRFRRKPEGVPVFPAVFIQHYEDLPQVDRDRFDDDLGELAVPVWWVPTGLTISYIDEEGRETAITSRRGEFRTRRAQPDTGSE